MEGVSIRAQDPKANTTRPIVTGTSVIGIKYDKGVLLAADTLASYGSMARYKDVQRIRGFGNNTVIGATGEMSDFQELENIVREHIEDRYNSDFGHDEDATDPKEIHHYLSTILYEKRRKLDPLYNELVVGGMLNGKPYLGYTDLYGSFFEDDYVVTGFGAYFALPIIREAYKQFDGVITRKVALKLLETCLRVLYYRDGRTTNSFTFAQVDSEGVRIANPTSIKTNWDISAWQEGKL